MKKRDKKGSFSIVIIFFVFFGLGLFSLFKIPVRLNPNNTLPSFTVSYSLFGASPLTVENKVTSILEGRLNRITGIKNIISKSSRGRGQITMYFDKNVNNDFIRFEIANIVRQAYSRLPAGLSYPEIMLKHKEEKDNYFLSFEINADDSDYNINQLVNNQIEPIISSISGVSKVRLSGTTKNKYTITYDDNVLKKTSIKKQDLLDALRRTFTTISIGKSFENEFIKISSTSNNNNWHIPIKKIKNRIIYLDDISTIKIDKEDVSNYYRINGKNTITLSIAASKEANRILLAKEIGEKISMIKNQLPLSYSIIENYNATNFLKIELHTIFKRAGYTVFILLLFIYIFSRDLYYLIITILSITFNLGIAFLFYYIFNLEIQLYSLAGITISLGLIIDNTIVMIEHIRRKWNTNVFIPLLASTLTTTGSLAVIYFLDEQYKTNLIDFAFVIIINLSVSLVISLFLIPALLNKTSLLKKEPTGWLSIFQEKFYAQYTKFITFLLRFKKFAFIGIILLFGVPLFMLPQHYEENNTFPKKVYNTTIGTEWYRDNIRMHVDTYLGGSFKLFYDYVLHNSKIENKEETKLLIRGVGATGSNIEHLNEVFLRLENYLQNFSKVNIFKSTINNNIGTIEITFKNEFVTTLFPRFLKNNLSKIVSNLGGIEWDVVGLGSGFSNSYLVDGFVNFTVTAKGYNYAELNKWADTLKLTLEKNRRVQKVIVKENSYQNTKPSDEFLFEVKREEVALKKSNPLEVFNELKLITLDKDSDLRIKVGGKQTAIDLVSNVSKENSLWRILNDHSLNSHETLRISEFLKIKKEREDESIDKENQEYIRKVNFQYLGLNAIGNRFLEEKLNELKIKLPLGYKFENKKNSVRLNRNKNKNYIFLLLLVIGVIYFVCAILFESLKQPFIILSIIPISFIGVFLTFYIFNFNFDQGGFASFVLLSGITVNSSIFILDEFNKLKKEQPSENYLQVYMESFRLKVFPILLTIFSTIIGFIPFILSGKNEVFWFALGAGTIGGLVFSLIGLLVFLPLFTLKNS